MSKSFWRFLLTVPAVILLYIPLILLLIETKGNPQITYSFGLFSIAFLCFWGGIALFAWTFKLIINNGEGTLTTQMSTAKLVREGAYQYLRNPMIVAIWMILAGETLYFESWYIFGFMIGIVLSSIYYVTKIEEFKLANQFGQPYILYKMDVGRWFPKARVFKEFMEKK